MVTKRQNTYNAGTSRDLSSHCVRVPPEVTVHICLKIHYHVPEIPILVNATISQSQQNHPKPTSTKICTLGSHNDSHTSGVGWARFQHFSILFSQRRERRGAAQNESTDTIEKSIELHACSQLSLSTVIRTEAICTSRPSLDSVASFHSVSDRYFGEVLDLFSEIFFALCVDQRIGEPRRSRPEVVVALVQERLLKSEEKVNDQRTEKPLGVKACPVKNLLLCVNPRLALTTHTSSKLI